MRLVNREELKGVLAHELSHVRNRDILITSMAAVLASAITWIAHWGLWLGGGNDRDRGGNAIFALLLAFLAPIAAMLLNLALSRSREYQAEESGAKLCHEPQALANALIKLEQATQRIPMQVNPALSSLYIVKPDPQSWFVNLLSTHPPLEERIKRLEEMQRQQLD
jgi:heat shock protein HtpX